MVHDVRWMNNRYTTIISMESFSTKWKNYRCMMYGWHNFFISRVPFGDERKLKWFIYKNDNFSTTFYIHMIDDGKKRHVNRGQVWMSGGYIVRNDRKGCYSLKFHFPKNQSSLVELFIISPYIVFLLHARMFDWHFQLISLYEYIHTLNLWGRCWCKKSWRSKEKKK